MRIHYNVTDKEIQLFLWHIHFKIQLWLITLDQNLDFQEFGSISGTHINEAFIKLRFVSSIIKPNKIIKIGGNSKALDNH